MTNANMQTNHGTIEIELFDADAPKTVENFKKLESLPEAQALRDCV